jgi:hypothetical protein
MVNMMVTEMANGKCGSGCVPCLRLWAGMLGRATCLHMATQSRDHGTQIPSPPGFRASIILTGATFGDTLGTFCDTSEPSHRRRAQSTPPKCTIPLAKVKCEEKRNQGGREFRVRKEKNELTPIMLELSRIPRLGKVERGKKRNESSPEFQVQRTCDVPECPPNAVPKFKLSGIALFHLESIFRSS